MDWYYNIALFAIISQLFLLFQAYKNYRYALFKHKKKNSPYHPRTVLIVPCRGLDSDFKKNIASFFNQDHEDYLLWFVVAEKTDPAYEQLCKLKNQLNNSPKAQDVQIFIAGTAKSCSQKIHNLLYCLERVPDDVEILAFADSDISVQSNWLQDLIWPLHRRKNGAATGYRWFIPHKYNLASLALSAINAKVAQLLGNTRFNHAWGGSMAIHADFFREIGLHKIWKTAFSDDLSLSHAVKKEGLKVDFVPSCLVASYESTSWKKLFEFCRRQFLITRVCALQLWFVSLLGSLYSVLGLWAGAALAVYAAKIADKNFYLYAEVPILFFISPFLQAILRQKMISKLLKDYIKQMKASMAADILGFWLWSILLLAIIISSAFGSTVTWRGIRYKLLGPNKTIVVDN